MVLTQRRHHRTNHIIGNLNYFHHYWKDKNNKWGREWPFEGNNHNTQSTHGAATIPWDQVIGCKIRKWGREWPFQGNNHNTQSTHGAATIPWDQRIGFKIRKRGCEWPFCGNNHIQNTDLQIVCFFQVLNLFLALLLSSFGASNLSAAGGGDDDTNKLSEAFNRIGRFIRWIKRMIFLAFKYFRDKIVDCFRQQLAARRGT